MLMKQVDHNGGGNNVRFGDSFTEDQFAGETFDYFLTNPPFGVDWKKQQKEIQQEHDKRGFDGRFGAGLPRVNDGSLLFLQHMIDKFEPVRPAEHKHGSRLAIVFSGSPLFTGGAGSGESDIRKWIIENDWLEAIIALPEQMFYNTGIGTYVWIVTNRKEKRRKGKIQLLDARDVWTAGGSEDNKRSLGDKRRHITGSQIAEIVQALRPADRRRDLQDLRQRRLRLHPRHRRAAAAPALPDDAGGQGPLPRRLPAPARRRAGHRQGARPRAAARLERGLEPHRGPAARAQVALEGDRAEALPQRLHAEGPRGRAGRQGRARRRLRARRRPARLRERAAQGRHRRLLRARGAPARARRLDGPQQGQGRLRDQLQPPLLQVHAAAAAGGDRRGAEAGGGRDHAVAAGGNGVTWSHAKLKFVVRFGYGDAIPTNEVQDGLIQVFGSERSVLVPSQVKHRSPCNNCWEEGLIWENQLDLEPCFASDTTFFIDSSTCKHQLRWAYWLLQTLGLDEGTDEAAVPGLNRETAYNKDVAVPPRSEQRAIAEFLDRETARLDGLVAAKERVLVLLAEKRRALITQVVTRGLDSKTPLRESGIPWLGKIPAHWNIERSRWLFRERDERSVTGEEEMLTVSHLTGVTPRSEKDVNMFEAETNEGYKICYAGDLVINTLWAWMGAMGVSSVKGIVSPAYHVYQPGPRLVPTYIDSLVRMPVFAQEVTVPLPISWTQVLPSWTRPAGRLVRRSSFLSQCCALYFLVHPVISLMA